MDLLARSLVCSSAPDLTTIHANEPFISCNYLILLIHLYFLKCLKFVTTKQGYDQSQNGIEKKKINHPTFNDFTNFG